MMHCITHVLSRFWAGINLEILVPSPSSFFFLFHPMDSLSREREAKEENPRRSRLIDNFENIRTGAAAVVVVVVLHFDVLL